MTPSASDPRLLRLADGDNVLIVLETIAAGQRLLVCGEQVESAEELPMGFKVAAEDLPLGTVALRYGTPIGKTTADVPRGRLVHTHNLASQYLRTHARGEA